MKSLAVSAAIALLVALGALPAAAQYGGGPPDDRPPVSPGQVQVTTPCSTIIVSGNSWGEGSVFIDRDFGDDDCPAQGNASDVTVTPQGGGQSNNDDDDESFAALEVPVAADGSFVAEVQVPADAVGTYEVTVRGTDVNGQSKYQTFLYDVVPLSSSVPAGVNDGGAGDRMTALASIGAAALLLLAFNWRRALHLIPR
jgi:hypothetical protein